MKEETRIEASALKAILPGLARVVGRKQTLPVLGCVHVRQAGDHVQLAVSDGEHHVSVLAAGACGPPLCVPLEDLRQAVKASKGKGSIRLQVVDGKVAIGYEAAGQQLSIRAGSEPVEEFPALPRQKTVECPLDEARKESLLHAMACASSDETRYILNGAFLDPSEPGHHAVVGTDGRHLYAANTLELPVDKGVILPSHGLWTWPGLRKAGDWTLMLPEKTGGMAGLKAGGWTWWMPTVDGNYPDYRQVMPDEAKFKARICMPGESLPEVLEMVDSLPRSEDSAAVGLDVTENGKLDLLARSAPDGPWTPVPVGAQVEGPPVRVFLDRKYLRKALAFGLGELALASDIDPVLFTAPGRKLVVMPMRIGDAEVREGNPRKQSETHNERKEMPMDTNNGQSNGSKPPVQELPALEAALMQAQRLREQLKELAGDAGNLVTLLRNAERERKAGEREIRSARSTLERLKAVEI